MPAWVMGDWPETIKRERHYFEERNIFVDCRGKIEISSTAHFGFEVMLLTASHQFDEEEGIEPKISRVQIQIDDLAWIASRALIYNSWIQHHAIVGAGAVVKSSVVPAYTVVEGNPARIVKIWSDGRYLKVKPRKLRRWET